MINWEEVQEQGWTRRKDGEFRILSIDGGGMKGIFPAQYLKNVEMELSKPLYEYFDLIVGTSTGGLIALSLALGFQAEKIVNLYFEKGREIFGKQRLFRGCGRKSKFDNKGLINVLKSTFGKSLLEEVKVLVCIPSIRFDKAEPTVYKTPHLSDFHIDRKIEVWKIALATSAAPYYFPAAIVNGDYRVDGGLWANNPVLVGISEAINLGVKLEEIKVLSIGTGTNIFQPNRAAKLGGILSWKLDLVELTMQSQSKGAYFAARYLIKDNLYRINFDTLKKIRLDTSDRDSLEWLVQEANNQFKHTFKTIEKAFFKEPVFA